MLNLKDSQTDKDGKLVVLYASNKEAQHAYIETAKEKGYEVLLLVTIILAGNNNPINQESLNKKPLCIR